MSYWYTRWRRILRFSTGKITEPYLPAKRHPGTDSRGSPASGRLCVDLPGVSLTARSWAAVVFVVGADCS